MIYGTEGTQALFTGLATQIVYGRCDHDTADFYSKASGTTTADANPDPQKANFRQRPLLTVDEVVTPQIGNCTIFARYVEPAFATQLILTARLTRLYEREDWQTRFASSKNEEPLLLERGVSVNVQPASMPPEALRQHKKEGSDTFAEAAKQRMAQAKAGKAGTGHGQPTMTDIRTMKNRAQQRQSTRILAQRDGEDVTRQK
jgi:type IV secretory pathway TraG/TraD family ATPase VirD4